MLKILYIILFFLINISLDAQSTEMIVPFYNKGKWGFMNKNKDIIVCPKYEEAYPSTSDRYRVKVKGKYGFIDNGGKLVIKAKYDSAEDFNYGIAKVTRKGNTKYITKEGKRNRVSVGGGCGTHYSCSFPNIREVVEIIEDQGKLGIVHEKMIRNENKKTYYVSDTIQPVFDSIIPIGSQLMYIVKDSLISFAHDGYFLAGADYILDNLNFEFEDVKLFSCDLCCKGVYEIIGVKKNGLWGYMKIDHEPEDFIEPKYLRINSFADGFALVEYEEEKFGYIDSRGNEYFIR